nr:hypothetical protein [uncultured Pseudomonas sp.]
MASQENALSVGNPGDLDPAFGVEGVVQVPAGSGTLRCMVEDQQGSIVHGLWVGNEVWLYRIFADGSSDRDFATDGVAKWGFAPGKFSVPVQLLLQADGKYVLIGVVRNDWGDQQPHVAITRFNSNGTPDLVFGNKVLPLPADGNVFTAFPSFGCLQDDGKILVAAPYTLLDQQGSLFYRGSRLHRLQVNGEVDPGFGGGRGFIDVQFSGQDTTVESVGVSPGGRILVAGTVDRPLDNMSHQKQSVARFMPSGALDRTFGRQGYWEQEGYNSTGRMILDDEERVIVVGREMAQSGNYYVCVSRLTADGEFDSAFNNGSRLLLDIPADIPGNYVNCSSVALQSDGKIIAAGHAGLNARSYWLRIQANGEVDSGFGHQGIHLYEPSHLKGGVLVQKDSQRVLAAIDSSAYPIPRIVGIQS